MAKIEIKCPHCGELTTIEDTREHAFCSNCGEKIIVGELNSSTEEAQYQKEEKQVESNDVKTENKTITNNETSLGKLILWPVVGVIAFFTIVMIVALSQDKETPNEDIAVVDSTRVWDDVSAEKVEKKEWSFSNDIDEMTDSKNIWATIVSDNALELDFPYNSTHAKIVVRYMKKYGYDVLIEITSGQIYGNEYSDENYIMARFDNDKPIKYWFNEPSDNSSDCVFIRKTNDFIMRCKKARTIRLEIPLYQAGRPVFEFNVDEPLKWQE